jgi:hypothetical protein
VSGISSMAELGRLPYPFSRSCSYYSFGPRADDFDIRTNPRLRAPLFEQCIEMLCEKEGVVVRVRDSKKYTIVIHDPNGQF